MSSHHIVREKQEPALLILSLEALDPDHLGQLLEWSPTVLVAAGLYDHVDSLGIKIDTVIGQLPRGITQPALSAVAGDDPLTTALHYLVSAGYPSVNIIAATFDAATVRPFVGRINVVALVNGWRIFPATAGFTKWKAAGERVRIIEDVSGLETANLVPDAMQSGTFIVVRDGFYTLRSPRQVIFVAELY